MHVVATAGHVDHGKSTLVRSLTGHNPDRLAEEQRRGLSIELGYAWANLGSAGDVAFVDVPGHERFVPTMLAGVGPVPAVLLVVAADDLWMPQAAEHLAALDAFGVSHGLVVVSRSDLADPAAAMTTVAHKLTGTTLQGAPVLPVSARTGAGLDALRSALVNMLEALPTPDAAADVRLWVDRSFSIVGAGTVVTGTLPAGTIRVGDLLAVGASTVRVRRVETLGRTTDTVSGVARVALNITGPGVRKVKRGSVLTTPGAWHHAVETDVSLSPLRHTAGIPPEQLVLHVGAASVGVHYRTLSERIGRLRLKQALPVRVGDRALLRDPGTRRAWAVTVLDPMPPPLPRRRGAAWQRGRQLSGVGGPDLASEVHRRGLVQVDELRRIGIPLDDAGIAAAAAVSADGWLMSIGRFETAKQQLATGVAESQGASPLAKGVPMKVLAARLGLPSVELVRALVSPPLRVEDGLVVSGSSTSLPDRVLHAIEVVHGDLAGQPFVAPGAYRLRELGLGNKEIAAAERAGLILRLAPGIVLLPGSDVTAVRHLAELPQPFTVGEARERLGTTRRVAIPLLEHLDRTGLTHRLADGRRLTAAGDASAHVRAPRPPSREAPW